MKNLNLIKKTCLLLGVLLIGAMFGVPSSAITTGRVGIEPANPDADNPRTKSIFVLTGESGDVIKEEVNIINNKDHEVKVLLYAADAATSNDGSFTCEQYSEKDDEEGGWIVITEEEHMVAPFATKKVEFSVAVPPKADVGEHNACVMLQEVTVKDKQAGANISTRVGLRIVITVPGEIKKELKIVSYKLIKDSDKEFLTAVVKNEGNVSVDATIKVKTSVFGIFDLVEDGGTFPVLRGEESTFNFPNKKFAWGGLIKAELEVKYNDDIDQGLGEAESEKILTHGFNLFLIPWWLFGVLLLAVVLYGLRQEYKYKTLSQFVRTKLDKHGKKKSIKK